MKIIRSCLLCATSILASNFVVYATDYTTEMSSRTAPKGPTGGIYAYTDSHGATGMYVQEEPQRFIGYPHGPQGMLPPYYLPYMGVTGPSGPTMGLTGSSYMGPQGIDPIIQCYTPQTVKMNADDLIHHYTTPNYKVNYLDFSNYNFTGSQLHNLVAQFDLSSIKNIDISCNSGQGTGFNSNDFLYNLFRGNSTLRSLTNINASGSNLQKDTLELLRDKVDFGGALIRDMWQISESTNKKVASIEVETSGTPIESLDGEQKKQLQIPAQKQLNILYRYDNYLPGSVAHLQIKLR